MGLQNVVLPFHAGDLDDKKERTPYQTPKQCTAARYGRSFVKTGWASSAAAGVDSTLGNVAS